MGTPRERGLAVSCLSAQAVSRVYNWWNLYLRTVKPRKPMEAICARARSMSAVDRLSEHINPRLIRIMPLHDFAHPGIARAQSGSDETEGLQGRWGAVVQCERWTTYLPRYPGTITRPDPPPMPPRAGSWTANLTNHCGF